MFGTLWSEVMRLPGTAIFGLLVAGVVMGWMLAEAVRLGALDLRDVWRRHVGRYLTERKTRLEVPNDRRSWWRGAA